jgi:DnaK suppressor protein
VKPAKSPAKPAPKPAAKSAKPAAKKAVKAPASKAPAAAKAAPPAPPKRAPIAAGARPVAPAPVIAPPPPMPAPRPIAPKPQAAVSTKDLAAAHEYLLSRSATRSEAPVIVNGKPLLTEERLLKMPESAYMNDEQLAFFKYRLQQMERELLANADETTEHLRETVIVPDPADRATIEEEHALELRTRDRERKLLKKVQQALGRIESGDYGFCEETGDPIGIPRLLARPTATLSLEAQQRRELKQKLYGD